MYNFFFLVLSLRMVGSVEFANIFFPYILCRSTILARLDGVEQASLIIGVCISPWALQKWGYVACFAFRMVGGFIAITYLGKASRSTVFSFHISRWILTVRRNAFWGKWPKYEKNCLAQTPYIYF